MRKEQFADGEYYHVFNRGVEKRKIFTMRRDYERFLFNLYACNDEQKFDNVARGHRGLASVDAFRTHRTLRRPYVSILCFCLMPNHFHLLLKQHGKDGISRFMQKLSTAYTMYFNAIHERVGALFQGTYRAVHIEDEAYLTHLSRYIHINPLDLLHPNWKEEGIKSPLEAWKFLRDYRWSSYRDYLGYSTYPYILDRSLLGAILGKPKEIRNFTQEWVEMERITEAKPR